MEFVDTNQEHVPTSKIDHFLAELWTFFLHVESFLQLEDFFFDQDFDFPLVQIVTPIYIWKV